MPSTVPYLCPAHREASGGCPPIVTSSWCGSHPFFWEEKEEEREEDVSSASDVSGDTGALYRQGVPLTDEATEADVPAPPSAPWHGCTFGLAWGLVSSAPDNR